MAVFTYTALDSTGRRTSGTIPADTRAAALDLVMSRGLSPIAVNEQNGKGNGNGHAAAAAATSTKLSTSTRVPQSAVESFTRELANLLGAGLPLSRALH